MALRSPYFASDSGVLKTPVETTNKNTIGVPTIHNQALLLGFTRTPHFGQLTASELTSVPHSLQLINAMSPPVY